ncbi:MAG: DUF1573 domain-containing protein [Bacteroidales bacterium]|nr:DUF1573 domain-containing protein [Bacteroidales bacterium]
MKLLLGILLTLALSGGPAVKFDSMVKDFGAQSRSINELSCDFTFTNTSSKSVSVRYAVPNCSCTTARWTQGEIAPGASGVVSVTYIRERYSSSFEKLISVFFTGEKKPVILRISGSFVDDTASLSEQFPYRHSVLGFDEESLDFGEVHPGKSRLHSLVVANFSDKAASLSFEGFPAGVSTIEPEFLIYSKSRKEIVFSFTPDSTFWGKRTFVVTPVVNGNKAEPVDFKALVLDDFSSLSSDEINNGAYYSFTSEVNHFGIIKAGTPASARVGIVNESDQELFIRGVSSSASGVKIDYPAVVQPRQKAWLNVSIDASALVPGGNTFVLSLVTNSPLKPYTEFEVKGFVE